MEIILAEHVIVCFFVHPRIKVSFTLLFSTFYSFINKLDMQMQVKRNSIETLKLV